MNKEQLVRITDLLESFNFHKVRVAMVAIDWKYYSCPWDAWAEAKVPTVKELKNTVFRLAEDLYVNPHARSEEGDLQIEGGGFRLRESAEGNLSLEFILEEYVENE